MKLERQTHGQKISESHQGMDGNHQLFFGKRAYIKSHDWKQIAVDGIMKFCLRGLLGQRQRSTFFRFLDAIATVSRFNFY